jgi:hypothetical protein
VVVHVFVIVVLSPLVGMFKVGGESAFCWRSLLQHFPCLVEVDLGVDGRHLHCAEVIEVVEHCGKVDVAVAALFLKPTY